MRWTLRGQISSAMDYKTDIRKDFRKMIFDFSN